jgi:hypothetical protein
MKATVANKNATGTMMICGSTTTTSPRTARKDRGSAVGNVSYVQPRSKV